MQYVKDFIDSQKALIASAVILALQHQNSCSEGLWQTQRSRWMHTRAEGRWATAEHQAVRRQSGTLQGGEPKLQVPMIYRAIYHRCSCGKGKQVWGDLVYTHTKTQKSGYSCTTWDTLQREEVCSLLEYAATSSEVPASVAPQWITSTARYLLHDPLHLSLLPPWNISADFTGNKAVSSMKHWYSAQLA